MLEEIIMPSIHHSPEDLADWLELLAIKKSDGCGSFQDLVQVIATSGEITFHEDAENNEDSLDLGIEGFGFAEDAFSELEERFSRCGGEEGAYPFGVDQSYIEARCDITTSVYTFLLLLSNCGKDAGPEDGAQLFEDICAEAALSYFGGVTGQTRAEVFGFPRRVLPQGFETALDELCTRMGEGIGCRDRPRTRHQKDAGLDIVVWTEFADRRAGKLIGFGQCATGKHWRDKLTELLPRNFCQKWIKGPLVVEPIKLFFVPHRIEEDYWEDVCTDAGIVFDRCRIAQHSGHVGESLMQRCAEWTDSAITGRLRS